MKTRILRVALCLLLMAALSVSAFADIIYEPDDAFYRQHTDECVYDNSAYLANGPDGAVTFYKSPKNDKEIYRVDNDTVVTISYVYTDKQDVSWGCCDRYLDGKFVSGWAPMAYLWEKYSDSMFRSQYSDAIHSGEAVVNEDGKLETVIFWTYPGSEEYYEAGAGENFSPSCDWIFTDEEGRDWGHVGYFMGRRNAWVFLNDPQADFAAIYPEGAPVRDTRERPTEVIAPKPSKKDDSDKKDKKKKKKDEEEEEEVKPDTSAEKRTLLYLGGAVVLVVLVTAVLLIVLRKKKKV